MGLVLSQFHRKVGPASSPLGTKGLSSVCKEPL